MWVGHDEFHDIIEAVSARRSICGQNKQISNLILTCGEHLRQWSKTRFKHVQTNLRKAQSNLKNLLTLDPLFSKQDEHCKERREDQSWLEKDKLMWRQRSRIMWLIEGCWNSKYFHQKASNCRRKNRILKLQASNGEWKEGNQLEDLIVDYFQFLFSTSNSSGSLELLETLTESG